MKLSILICSVHTRRETFLPKMLKSVFDQYESLTVLEKDQVEILVLLDNKQMMLGTKRNYLIDMAGGEYVIFVDDDDRIAPDYIRTLLYATYKKADCITFLADVSLNGDPSMTCYYSIRYEQDNNPGTHYERLPNHICAIKREIAEKVRYQDVLYGEDVPFAKEVKQYLKTETHIDRVLYFYDYSEKTTETQSILARRKDRLKRLRR